MPLDRRNSSLAQGEAWDRRSPSLHISHKGSTRLAAPHVSDVSLGLGQAQGRRHTFWVRGQVSIKRARDKMEPIS